MKRKKAGILLPIFSLPSNYGIGTFGDEAYKFIDFLKKAGQSYWQILPLGPTSFGDSPYASFSTFALNPYFIDLDVLISEKLIDTNDVKPLNIKFSNAINYKWLYDTRFIILKRAYQNGITKCKEEFTKFKKENKSWLDDYALFMSLKKCFNDSAWIHWPDKRIIKRDKEAINDYKKHLGDDIEFYKFIQYLAYKQYFKLKKYANKNGIKIIGDVPIYVPLDSCDIWANPEQFKLTSALLPKEVSGVPPDAFTKDGQLWGNPIYNWNLMKKDNYNWWIKRIKGASSLYDVVRIDHFRGFESYWSVKYGSATAKNGVWKKGPSTNFLNVLKKRLPKVEYIAEDLGYHTKAVQNMLDDFGYPGMKVLEFAFDSKEPSDHLPHQYTYNFVSYLGTHDNSTCLGYLKSLDKKTLKYVKNYCGLNTKEGYVWGMIRVGMQSEAKLFVVQLQDYLNLDDKARINTPGTVGKNWLWRTKKDSYNAKLANKIYKITKNSSRL